LNPPANVYIYCRKDSNEASEQLVAWEAGNLWRYDPIDDDVTGLIIGAEFNYETTLSGIPVMVMARGKPITINYPMLVNPFGMNAVKTAQSRSWSYEEVARIDPVQRNSDPLRAYISVVNESSQ